MSHTLRDGPCLLLILVSLEFSSKENFQVNKNSKVIYVLLFTPLAVGVKIPVRKPPINSKPLLVRLEHKVPKLVTVLKNSHSRIRSASAGRDRKSGKLHD